MPVCYITLSNKVSNLNKQQLLQIRRYVANRLDSKSRKLDETHIAIRLQHSERDCMLGDIEIDVFCQLYIGRLFSRDKRAYAISQDISKYLDCCCATWINMSIVGYSRVSEKGNVYFSDSDNAFLHLLQQLHDKTKKNN